MFIKEQTGTRVLTDLCRALGMSRSGYYQLAFTRHAARYGTRRLRAELLAEGHRVGRYALRNWLKGTGKQALSTCPNDRALRRPTRLPW